MGLDCLLNVTNGTCEYQNNRCTGTIEHKPRDWLAFADLGWQIPTYLTFIGQVCVQPTGWETYAL